MLGFGVFVMVRRQMLNLKRLAEGRQTGPTTAPEPVLTGSEDVVGEPIPEVMTSAGIA